MTHEKIRYNEGNNDKFNFYILAEKKEVNVDQNSLAFKVDNTNAKSLQIEHNGITGNFDLLLRMETKDGIFKGYILCDYDDVQKG